MIGLQVHNFLDVKLLIYISLFCVKFHWGLPPCNFLFYLWFWCRLKLCIDLFYSFEFMFTSNIDRLKLLGKCTFRKQGCCFVFLLFTLLVEILKLLYLIIIHLFEGIRVLCIDLDCILVVHPFVWVEHELFVVILRVFASFITIR